MEENKTLFAEKKYVDFRYNSKKVAFLESSISSNQQFW